MGLLKPFLAPFLAAALAIVFLLQSTIIYTRLIQPGIGIMPAGSSHLGLFRRQDTSDVYKYFGHQCRIEGKTDPVAEPGNLICNPPWHGSFADAHESQLNDGAEHFCKNYFDPSNSTSYQDPVLMPISRPLWVTNKQKEIWPAQGVYGYERDMNFHHDVYVYQVDWIYGCPTDDVPPVPVLDCVQYMWKSWKQCYNNQGRGGTLEIGCYKFSASPMW